MGNGAAKHPEKDPDSLFEQDITTLLEWLTQERSAAPPPSQEDKAPEVPPSSETEANAPAAAPPSAHAPKLKLGSAANKHGYSDSEIVAGLGQKLYDTEVSMEAIFTAIEFHALRSIRDNKPLIFIACVETVIQKLEGIVVSGTMSKEDKRLPLTLNCLRAAARFVVAANEDQEGKASDLLWSNPIISRRNSVTQEKVETKPSPGREQDSDNISDYCLAKRLLCALANLLFIPGFTIPEDLEEKSSSSTNASDPLSFMDDSRSLVWERQGDRINLDIVNTLDGNRVETLRALLACLCGDLFVTTENYKHDRNRWIKAFVETSCYPSLRPRINVANAVVRPLVRPTTVFWSIFNVIFNYNPNPKIKGFALLPNTLTDISTREMLVTMGIHLLLVFLEFRQIKFNADDSKASDDDSAFTNYYLKSFRDIRRPKDLEVLFESLTRILQININVAAQMVPAGLRSLEIYDEVIILTWKLVDENRAFNKLVLNSASSPELIRPILFYLCRYKDDPSKSGLLHACALTLLRLSAERDFSVALNSKYDPQLPLEISKIDNGSLADLLIAVVYKLIMSQLPHLESLYHVLLTILQNVSPYMTRLTMASSLRLIYLFEVLSSPQFLTASQSNYSYVIFLLDIFNNLIQYQYNGSARLVYCMLKRANLFYDLLSWDASSLNELARTSKPAPKAAPAAPQKFVRIGDNTEQYEEEVKAAIAACNRGAFVEVTPEFYVSWREKLHTKALFALLEYLIPRLKDLVTAPRLKDLVAQDRNQIDNEEAVLALIERTTVVGILPAPHPIVVRRYTNTMYTTVWFTTYIWGLIFLRNERPVLFDPPSIKLFVCGYAEEPNGNAESKQS